MYLDIKESIFFSINVCYYMLEFITEIIFQQDTFLTCQAIVVICDKDFRIYKTPVKLF